MAVLVSHGHMFMNACGPFSHAPAADMLSRTATHYSHTTDIGTVECCLPVDIVAPEAIRQTSLVGSDPTTHLTVWPSTDWEKEQVASH